MMRKGVGLIGFATDRGIGHLARDFVRHGVADEAMVVLHDALPNHLDWFPAGSPTTRLEAFDLVKANAFCRRFEGMLFVETPFIWGLLDHCRAARVRTAIITMHECTPARPTSRPDVWICPSELDMQCFDEPKVFLPLPTEMPFHLRTTVKRWVHRGGHNPTREGTHLVIEAMRHVKSDVALTVFMQEDVDAEHRRMAMDDGRVELVLGTAPFKMLHADCYDALVQPQSRNGCSLPLQEAFASGQLVVTTDRFPMNTWLPRPPLIPVQGCRKNRLGGCMEFDEAIIDPKDIAAAMDRWHGAEVSNYSWQGKRWAEGVSWEKLGPQYRKAVLG